MRTFLTRLPGPGSVGTRLSLLLSLAVGIAAVLSFLACGTVLAYNEGGTADPSVTDCILCHGDDYQSGPHGGYLSTTRSCQACHAIHDAPAGSFSLLPGPTIKATCLACHDGSGGSGVYGTLLARGLAPVSLHRIDVTSIVPGGDPSTGTTATTTFIGEDGYLTCDDCHSPHGSETVNPFTGDRSRIATDVTFLSDRLLRMRPTSGTTTVTVYGSDWCASCHKGRTSGTSTVHNHPVDSLMTTSTPFYYEYVSRVTSENEVTTEYGTLGRTNRGYYIPYPRTAEQGGHDPICQQCHEDARSVGTSYAIEPFVITAPDGTNASDNPRFQVFPHESENPSLLVETGEDLCTNCHDSGSQMP